MKMIIGGKEVIAFSLTVFGMSMVSALMGHQRMMAAYEHAISQEYRFYSYGDAMLIL